MTNSTRAGSLASSQLSSHYEAPFYDFYSIFKMTNPPTDIHHGGEPQRGSSKIRITHRTRKDTSTTTFLVAITFSRSEDSPKLGTRVTQKMITPPSSSSSLTVFVLIPPWVNGPNFRKIGQNVHFGPSGWTLHRTPYGKHLSVRNSPIGGVVDLGISQSLRFLQKTIMPNTLKKTKIWSKLTQKSYLRFIEGMADPFIKSVFLQVPRNFQWKCIFQAPLQ